MSNITFSVILPCHNIADYLRPCLDSIWANDMTDNELILIDDGSTDNFAEVCQEYWGHPSEEWSTGFVVDNCRIVIIRQANHGVSNARNRGIHLSTKEYCLFVDPDDTVSPKWIPSVRESLAADPCEMLLYGYTMTGKESSEQTEILPLCDYHTTTHSEVIEQILPRYMGRSREGLRSWIQTGEFTPKEEHHAVWRVAYDRDFLVRNNILFPEDIVLNEDGIFNCHCLAHATSVHSLPASLYNYHLRPKGAYSGGARSGQALVRNKSALLRERAALLDTLRQSDAGLSSDCFAGSVILSIYEMLLAAPEEFPMIGSEYIRNSLTEDIIHSMTYLGKAVFDLPLFALKHKMFGILRLIFFFGRLIKPDLVARYR